MLIEHKIKLETNGLTITQRIESGFQTPPLKSQAGVEQKRLSTSFAASQAANAVPSPSAAAKHVGGGNRAENPRGPGGGDPGSSGSGPVTIIGPIILICPSRSATSSESEVNNGE
ncbi:MAG: hypothetical protein ACJ73N_09835 [Bryobacteraceae bacterium]